MLGRYFTLPLTESAYLLIEAIEEIFPCFTKIYWNEDEICFYCHARKEDTAKIEKMIQDYKMKLDEDF